MHLDENGQPTSPHKRRMALCGDLPAAIVLDQLCYWWSRGTRFFRGVEWRAKPRDQLAAELGMTLKQVTRALAILTLWPPRGWNLPTKAA